MTYDATASSGVVKMLVPVQEATYGRRMPAMLDSTIKAPADVRWLLPQRSRQSRVHILHLLWRRLTMLDYTVHTTWGARRWTAHYQ